MKKNNHVALDALDLPYDLKKLDIDQCKQLCGEIRDILVETVSKNGGHLASNLGVVELTMAIHRAFNSPEDKIVWDVGHPVIYSSFVFHALRFPSSPSAASATS